MTGTTTLNVTKAPLTVNVNSFTRQYGTPNPTFTGTITGAVNSDVINVTYSTTATIASPVGTYRHQRNVTGANIANYNVIINSGTLTITASRRSAGLVVTLNNATRHYGAPNPPFTGTITGAVNGDTFTITYSTTATIASPVGTYPITATVSGAAEPAATTR